MATGSYTVNVDIGGIHISQTINRTGDHPNPYEPSIAAASAGTINARTNNTKSNVTLSANHGLTNGTYDCFFTSNSVAYGCTGVVSGNTLQLNNANGDAFPANNTTCQVAKVTNVQTAIDGDNAEIIAILLEDTDTSSTQIGHARFMDSGDNEIAEIDLTANAPQVWDIAGGANNPFTGNPITYAHVSHNDTSEARTLKIASLEDSTP